MSEHTFDDLVRAWRARRSDPVDGGRYWTLAKAFGADLDRPPETAPALPAWAKGFGDGDGDGWAWIVHDFALGAQERLETLGPSPFADLLEAPPVLHAAYERHAAPIAEHLEGAREALDRLVLELLEALYPQAAGRTVQLPAG